MFQNWAAAQSLPRQLSGTRDKKRREDHSRLYVMIPIG
jgi:hypothetical protein